VAIPEPAEVPEPQRVEDVHRSVLEFPAARAKPEIGPTVPASPSVRRLARELGVDILDVSGSGPGGRISRDDVKGHAKRIVTGVAASGASGPGVSAVELPDFSQWGEVATEPLSNIRRATAKNLSVAWATVPHVTQYDRADITQLESMRKRFNKRDEAAGRKLTMTAIVLKMVAAALRQFPKFNASLDLANDVVILKKYIHLGVAVDTERGLLVPVIRDADRKGLVEVAGELNDLAKRARDKKLGLDEMNGASFTVSNLGGLGTTYFSPIVNWPQVAILGVGRAEHQAIFDEGQFQPRLMMPLSISYDHRIIDGADAARFLRWLAEALEQPLLLLLDE
jgi:pyruvate dehydrogenase E2 component (dihydrolipoamide acetyltransferase)